ncbi:MAG: STAS domain-containing protein [Bacteroidales bacterium]
MNVTKEELNDHLLLTVDGRLDTTQSDAFEKEMMQVLEEGNKKIIMDCSGLNYISSSGLRIFLTMQKRMMAVGGTFKICNLQPSIQEIFDMSGFSMIFSIFPDQEAALKG